MARSVLQVNKELQLLTHQTCCCHTILTSELVVRLIRMLQRRQPIPQWLVLILRPIRGYRAVQRELQQLHYLTIALTTFVELVAEVFVLVSFFKWFFVLFVSLKSCTSIVIVALDSFDLLCSFCSFNWHEFIADLQGFIGLTFEVTVLIGDGQPTK